MRNTLIKKPDGLLCCYGLRIGKDKRFISLRSVVIVAASAADPDPGFFGQIRQIRVRNMNQTWRLRLQYCY